MNVTYDITIGLGIMCSVVGFVFGFIGGRATKTSEYSKLKGRPLTYYELTKLPDGTEVLLMQYLSKERGYNHKEHGTIYTRKDGSKAIDVYDGDIEFTQADVWLSDRTGGQVSEVL